MFVSSANGHKCCNIATVYKISHFIVQCFTSPKKRGTSRKYILFLSFYAFYIIYTTQCQNFDFTLRKDHRKISYGQRAYESVDDTRLA